MERKPFSMGVRIEHRQSAIDLAQYGRPRGELPPADYSLNVHLPDGTSAYTFCMCPGGQVFAAASEEGGVVTNGMSDSRRDGENANAALLVTLHTEDFPGEGVLAGMEWQREIERAAYACTGSYRAPAQLVGDFLAKRPSTGPGPVQPSYTPGVFWGDLRRVLPEEITGVNLSGLHLRPLLLMRHTEKTNSVANAVWESENGLQIMVYRWGLFVICRLLQSPR